MDFVKSLTLEKILIVLFKKKKKKKKKKITMNLILTEIIFSYSIFLQNTKIW